MDDIKLMVSIPPAENSRSRKMIDALEHEFRVYLDPDDPESDFYVILVVTSTETVRNPETGETVAQMVAAVANPSPVTETQNGVMTPELLTKLNSIAYGATNYAHPSTHPASMITETADRRFVTDDLLAELADLTAGAGGVNISNLVESIAHISFQLALQGLINTDGIGNVIVDVIDSPDAVNIVSGRYADNKIII